MHADYFLSLSEEKERYEEHNNDVNDSNYQQFVSPIVNRVLTDFSKTDTGLDFGSGTGPVISKMLRDAGYTLTTYDPFFDKNESALNKQYDFIVCCEVIEHFHSPTKEFALLKNLLKPKGKLYCMTDMYSEDLNFEKWYYKNDPTHVFFYSKKALEYIRKRWGFSELGIKERLIVLTI
jgi:2-polyprenyl-3-methyl-5-hydroxy-6-metoxy-1,4-benzoquinol methylase